MKPLTDTFNKETVLKSVFSRSLGTVITSPTLVDSSNAQVTILEDLEYYVHQYDNALLFADLGGVKDIVTPSLNSRYGLSLMPI